MDYAAGCMVLAVRVRVHGFDREGQGASLKKKTNDFDREGQGVRI